MTEPAVPEPELTSNSPDDGQQAKRWGWVSARPSEYLVVYRRGSLAPALCGQGARFFKRPSDACAVVPTTLKQVVFQANQVTADLVDVRLRGMVLYRITDPVRIAGLINFTRRPRAEAKLGRMIADMCRSTSKWLVANMALQECVRQRKEEIAAALKREVAAVATEGWGVEVVAIDIQDVYVQDAELFESMQVAYKARQQEEARLAQLELESSIERRKLAHERAQETERQALALERAQREADIQLQRLALEQRCAEEGFALQRLKAEQERELTLREAEHQAELARLAAEQRRAQASLDCDVQRLLHAEEAQTLRERLEAEGAGGRASLERLFLRESLPALAQALASSLEGSQVWVQQGEGGAQAGPVGFAIAQVLGLLDQRLAGFGAAAPAASRVEVNGGAS